MSRATQPMALGVSLLGFNSCIALYAATDISQHLEQILTALRPLIESRGHEADAENTSDNGCGAVARIICTTPQLVPLEHVLPVLITGLPLVKDYLEYTPVLQALLMIVRDNLAEVNLTWLLGFIADTVDNYTSKTRAEVAGFLKMAAAGPTWAGLVESIGQEKAAKLVELIRQ